MGMALWMYSCIMALLINGGDFMNAEKFGQIIAVIIACILRGFLYAFGFYLFYLMVK